MIRATVELMKSEVFTKLIQCSDIIMTYPTNTDWDPQIAYGAKALEEITKSGKSRQMAVLKLIIDWTSDEPEHLAAILIMLKGHSEIFSPVRGK